MAVTNLARTQADGRIYLEWDQTENSSDHLVYRHTVEITDANVGAATLVATVRGTSARNLRRTSLETGTVYFTTPNGAREAGKGLCVLASENGGTFYYGVIVSGDSFVSGVNATTAALANVQANAVAILQGTATMDDGRTARMYCYWSPGNDAFGAGLIGFTFAYLRSAGFVSGTTATTVQTAVGLLVRSHGGTASYFDGQVEAPQDLPADVGMLNIDDVWLETTAPYGADTTYGMGAGENHPTDAIDGDTVQLFIRTAYESIIDWVIANEEDALIDSDRVWMIGQSAGAAVAYRLGHKMRTKFAACLAIQGAWDFGDAGLSSRADIDDLWGTVAHDNLADDASTNKIYDLTKVSWEVANADDSYPPFYSHNGSNDTVVEWDPVSPGLTAFQSNGHQIQLSWDEGTHGNIGIYLQREVIDTVLREIMEYRLDKPFLALRNCSLDEDISTDATGYINGALRQWPLEGKVSTTRCSVPLSLRRSGMPFDADAHRATVDVRPRRLTANSLTWAEDDYVQFTSQGARGIAEQRLLVANSSGEVEATGVEVTREKRDMVFEDWTLPVAADEPHLWCAASAACGNPLYVVVFGPASQGYSLIGIPAYMPKEFELASGTIGASGYSLVTIQRTAFRDHRGFDLSEGRWLIDLRFGKRSQGVSQSTYLR